MGDETLESGIHPHEWGDTGGLDEVRDDGMRDEVAVMLRLLSPPTVPDTVWFSRATQVLMRCDGRRLVTRPNRGCELMLECLGTGAFRSQSAVLDFLRAACSSPSSHSSKCAPASSSPGIDKGGLPESQGVLEMMVEDDGMAVLTAALALCREQEEDRESKEAKNVAMAELAKEVAEQEARAQIDHSDDDSVYKEEKDDRDGAASVDQSSVLVRQNCCEDPFDCEEPAVREAALSLLACIAQRICDARRLGREQELVERLLPVVGGAGVLRDVLEAMQVPIP